MKFFGKVDSFLDKNWCIQIRNKGPIGVQICIHLRVFGRKCCYCSRIVPLFPNIYIAKFRIHTQYWWKHMHCTKKWIFGTSPTHVVILFCPNASPRPIPFHIMNVIALKWLVSKLTQVWESTQSYFHFYKNQLVSQPAFKTVRSSFQNQVNVKEHPCLFALIKYS